MFGLQSTLSKAELLSALGRFRRHNFDLRQLSHATCSSHDLRAIVAKIAWATSGQFFDFRPCENWGERKNFGEGEGGGGRAQKGSRVKRKCTNPRKQTDRTPFQSFVAKHHVTTETSALIVHANKFS